MFWIWVCRSARPLVPGKAEGPESLDMSSVLVFLVALRQDGISVQTRNLEKNVESSAKVARQPKIIVEGE